LTAEVLSNVVMQLCSHTVAVVEHLSNPLARAQFFAQAWSNVVIEVPVVPPAAVPPPVEVAPPAIAEPPAAEAPPVALAPPVVEAPPAVALVPPVAEAPPAAVVPPVAEAPLPVLPPVEIAAVWLSLLQDQTQQATPNTRTSCPMLFFNMQFLTEIEVTRARHSSQEAS
jgi:hypothetical protein